MTHPEILAKYLAENGFEVIDERIVQDGSRDDRIYRIISAKFDGKRRELTFLTRRAAFSQSGRTGIRLRGQGLPSGSMSL
jgi:tRNA A22 N-methylase